MEIKSLLIDRPGAEPAFIGKDCPTVAERPGDEKSPIWMICDIELASGQHLFGAVRITPPQDFRGAPQISRPTAILAVVNDKSVDLLSGSERVRAGLAACDTIPLRFRLRENPPFETIGLDEIDPTLPLEAWIWTRHMHPVDLAEDVARLAPMAW